MLKKPTKKTPKKPVKKPKAQRAQNTQAVQGSDPNKTAEFHKERKSHIWKLAAVLLVVLIVLLVVLNWKSIISPFKDAALTVSGGFPIQLPGSTEYTLDEMGDSFYLMTDTYVYTYNGMGAQITSIQHGMQNPVAHSNDKRVLVYDKNGKEMKLYSRTAEVYSVDTDDTIVLAGIGSDERSFVVTNSTSYSNVLFVYGDNGSQIFRWASVENKIMQVVFSDDERSIFVTCAGAEGGELRMYLYRFDLNNEEGYIWKTPIGSDLTFSLSLDSDGLYIVTSGGNLLVDERDGEILSSGSFTGELKMLPKGGKLRTAVFGDSSTNGYTVVAYDGKLAPYAKLDIPSANRICCEGDMLYVLSGNTIACYDKMLNPAELITMEESYSDMLILGMDAILISYNKVDRVAL